MPNQLKHVFFDLDHTLWDFEKNSDLAFAEIFLKNNITLDLPLFLKHYSPINFEYWARYRNDQVTKEDLRHGRLEDTFKEIEIAITKQQIALLAEDYIAYLPKNNHLFVDTLLTLDYLQSKYKLHIITNGFSEVQSLKLNNSNINHYFETITTSEEAGVKKPNAKIFELALAKAKAKPNESLMIGDSLEADVLGAESYGIKAIWYNYSNPNNFKGRKIKQLKQLLEIL